MKITAFGSGYVGLLTGACQAEVGNHVVCLDVAAAVGHGTIQFMRAIYAPIQRNHNRLIATDVRKLLGELGWKPTETFETGIGKTVMWYLDNPDWVARVQSGAYRDWVQKQYETA